MHEHTTIPLPHPQRLTEDPCTEIVCQDAGSVRDVAMHGDRAIEFISIKSLAAKGEDEPGIMVGTADVPHQIAAAHLLLGGFGL